MPAPSAAIEVVDLVKHYGEVRAVDGVSLRIDAGEVFGLLGPNGAGKTTTVEILVGPAHENDGTLNLFGALRTSMATTGYETVKEFQKAEVMVAPSLQTEGKALQRAQGIGMGR